MREPEENVLDATCGGRTIWLDGQKRRDNVLYTDVREKEPGFHGQEGRTYAVQPDEIADFRKLPYESESFDLAVFDPPHVTRENGMEQLSGRITKKYGALEAETWQADIHAGFDEIFRTLRPGGTLIFKFNDESKPFEQVIDLSPYPALFGTTTKKRNTETRFYVFRKPRD